MLEQPTASGAWLELSLPTSALASALASALLVGKSISIGTLLLLGRQQQQHG